jgi:hypothetical protein
VNGNGHLELSVIITTDNAAGTIERCLQSLRAQGTERRYEVIVVDSRQDNTARRVREGFPEIRLLTIATRKYCKGARNGGIPHAEVDWRPPLIPTAPSPRTGASASASPTGRNTRPSEAASPTGTHRTWSPGQPVSVSSANGCPACPLLLLRLTAWACGGSAGCLKGTSP